MYDWLGDIYHQDDNNQCLDDCNRKGYKSLSVGLLSEEQ